MKLALVLALFLSACASHTPDTILRPEKNRYVLVELRENDRQRFDYYMDPSYEIRQIGFHSVEVWRNGRMVEAILGPCSVTTGPNPVR